MKIIASMHIQETLAVDENQNYEICLFLHKMMPRHLSLELNSLGC